MEKLNALTEEQKRLVESLIRLGDDLDLAIKTALNQPVKDNSTYALAYES